jgi:WD40 repeat protein
MILIDGYSNSVPALAFSKDGESLFIPMPNGEIQRWRANDNPVAYPVKVAEIQSFAVSMDGRFLVVGGSRGVISVWRLDDNLLHAERRLEDELAVLVTWVGPAVVLASVCFRGGPVARPSTMFLSDLTLKTVRRFPFDVVNGVRSMVGVPEKRLAVWVTDTRQLHVQDITRPAMRPHVLRNECRALAVSPDARTLAVASDWEILIFDISRWPSSPTKLGRHQGVVSALAFSADGRELLSGGWDSATRLWDLERGVERMNFSWPIGRVMSLAVASDGLRAAAGGDLGKVAIWDLE